MIKLEQNERIDWFRIIADLKRAGVSIVRVSRDLDIPKSTIQGWTQEIGNPRLEVGLRVIEFWAEKCRKKLGMFPDMIITAQLKNQMLNVSELFRGYIWGYFYLPD